MPKPLAISSYLQEEYGVKLKAPTDRGTVEVIDPESGDTFELDVKGLVKADFEDAGISTDIDSLELTSPDNPMAASGLSFSQQIGLAKAVTKKDREAFIKREFNSADVASNKDGSLSVRGDDGQWYSAEPDSAIATFLGKDAAATAGAAIGAEIGAGAGTAIAPGLGTAVGGILGAGIGGIVGKIANVASAYNLGIRTDADAGEIASELATEGLYAMAGQSVVPAAGLALQGVKGIGTAIGKVRNVFKEGAGREAAINWVATATDVDPKLATAFWDNTDDVMKNADEMIKFKKTAKATDLAGLDPLTQKQVGLVQNTVDAAKTEMSSAFGNFVKENELAFGRTVIPEEEVSNIIAPTLKKLSLVDDNGKWLSEAARDEAMSPVWQGKDLRALRTVYEKSQAIARRGEGVLPSKEMAIPLNGTELQRLIQGIDSLIEMKPLVGAEVSTQTQRALFEMRSSLRTLLGQKLPEEVSKKYGALTQQYSSYRGFLDEMARSIDEGVKVTNFTEKLMGKRGAAQMDDFSGLMKTALGEQAALNISNTLINLEAGKAFSHYYRKTAGAGVLQATMGSLTGPRRLSQMTSMLSPNRFQKLKDTAKAVEGMRYMPKGSLVSNPEAIKEIINSAYQSQAIRQVVGQGLMQGASQAIGGAGGQQ